MTELGLYDTTATIDYILAHTGFKDVITLGHSMGTTNVLIAASLRPEYQDKVRLNMLWGQSVFIGNMNSKGGLEVFYTKYQKYNYNNQQSAFAGSAFQKKIMSVFCDPDNKIGQMCIYILGAMSGFGSTQTVESAAQKMTTKYPSGSSLNVAKHMVQNMRSGEFTQLSYGLKGNMKRYGAPTPPSYPIGNVTTPTAIYYACCNDQLSDAKDAHILKRRLRNVVHFKEIAYKYWNHGDYLWAKDGYKLLYRDALMLIDQYTPLEYRSRIPFE
uniref:Lipase 3 n=1 Tax=Cacopsylla melanoneura TaxID=428564 RepID=A0A8D8Z7W9_9HEMI